MPEHARRKPHLAFTSSASSDTVSSLDEMPLSLPPTPMTNQGRLTNMERASRNFRCPALALIVLTSLAGVARGDQLINYTTLGTSQVSSLDTGGVTVTGSGLLNVNDPQGLGIQGGLASNPYANGIVESAESITFRFDSAPAVGIAVTYGTYGTTGTSFSPAHGDTLVTAFGTNGQSLGTVDLIPSAVPLNISSAFSNQPIASFTLQPKGSGNNGAFFDVEKLDYTSVPEPATLMIWSSVVLALLSRSYRRRLSPS